MSHLFTLAPESQQILALPDLPCGDCGRGVDGGNRGQSCRVPAADVACVKNAVNSIFVVFPLILRLTQVVPRPRLGRGPLTATAGRSGTPPD